jgi:hypothetical protein
VRESIKLALANPATRDQALDAVGAWVKETCLLFGVSAATAYKLAWIFTEGLAAEYNGGRPDHHVVR